MGGSGDAHDVGNDGLTHAQRQVKSVLDSERHRENPDGLTADQVCREFGMPLICCSSAQSARSSMALRADATQLSSDTHAQTSVCSCSCVAGVLSCDAQISG